MRSAAPSASGSRAIRSRSRARRSSRSGRRPRHRRAARRPPAGSCAGRARPTSRCGGAWSLLEALTDDVLLDRDLTARSGLLGLHLGECAADVVAQLLEVGPHEQLADEVAAPRERQLRDLERALEQGLGARLVHAATAGGIRRHVGAHDVEPAQVAEQLLDVHREHVADLAPGAARIAAQRAAVEADELAARADLSARVLQPGPRRAAEVEHPHAGLEQLVLLVDLGELVDRAREEPFLLRLLMKAIAAVRAI